MKYNTKLSDYNSEKQKFEDIENIGNTIFNNSRHEKSKEAWIRIKDYLRLLDEESESLLREDYNSKFN